MFFAERHTVPNTRNACNKYVVMTVRYWRYLIERFGNLHERLHNYFPGKSTATTSLYARKQ